MTQLLIFLAVGVFIAVLMRKKRHRPNRRFTPKPVSKSFSRNPNNEGKSKTSATIHQFKRPNEVEHPPIVGGCWVVDGDTIHIGSNKIRLQGINAPELNEPYGKQAKWALHKLVKGQTITAYPNGEKSYDRIVAKCFLEDGRDLAAEMVKMELALDLPNYLDADYKHFETSASRRIFFASPIETFLFLFLFGIMLLIISWRLIIDDSSIIPPPTIPIPEFDGF